MNPIFKLWANEPAMVVGTIVAILALLVSFGVPLKVDQQNAIRGVAEAIGVLVAAYVVRSQVSPVAKLP
jgi:hypothetical protein